LTSAHTNYGVVLGKWSGAAYVTIGEVVSIDPPEYSNAAVEATNHGSSGGQAEWVAGKLLRMSEFKVKLNYVSANIATLVTDMTAGTKSQYQILYPSDSDKQKFYALVTGVKPLPADAQKPDVMQAEITFQPSDSISLSS
jgi:hypothetical protein